MSVGLAAYHCVHHPFSHLYLQFQDDCFTDDVCGIFVIPVYYSHSGIKLEQRCIMKYLVKLGENRKGAYMSNTIWWRWYEASKRTSQTSSLQGVPGEVIVCKNRRITVRELAEYLSISIGSMFSIIQRLGHARSLLQMGSAPVDIRAKTTSCFRMSRLIIAVRWRVGRINVNGDAKLWFWTRTTKFSVENSIVSTSKNPRWIEVPIRLRHFRENARQCPTPIML